MIWKESGRCKSGSIFHPTVLSLPTNVHQGANCDIDRSRPSHWWAWNSAVLNPLFELHSSMPFLRNASDGGPKELLPVRQRVVATSDVSNGSRIFDVC